MTTFVPVPTVVAGNIYTPTMYNNFLAANLNKLLNTGHRVLTVAQFAALSSPEGTKGTVAPDEAYVEVDATNGVVWHFHYESTDGSSSKWRFIGGPPLWSTVETSESTASGTFVDLATVGPSITLPRGGDFMAHYGFMTGGNSGGNATAELFAGASDLGFGCVIQAVNASGGSFQTSRPDRITGRATSDVIKLKYDVSNAVSTNFSRRFLAITPIRIL